MSKGMAVTNLHGANIYEEIEKIYRQQKEYEEKTLAEIITKYDFIVGSKECKHRLVEVLPEGANIICSPYIDSPTTIYAIKKFDAMDYIKPQGSVAAVVTHKNLCDSCITKGCIFQSGIIRNRCDFYKAESENKE